MQGSRRLSPLVVAMLALGCGRAEREETHADPQPFTCGSDASSRNDDAKLKVLATGPGLRLEGTSGDGTRIAYTRGADPVVRDVLSVSADGSDTTLVAPALEVASMRFEGSTLFIFEPSGNAQPNEDHARRLLAWRAGDAALTPLAADVDPGSLHASRDGRWLSIEANDADGDGVRSAEIVLVDIPALSVESIAALRFARARFTRDSRFLIFGGTNPPCFTQVSRHSLTDGSEGQVTCLELPQTAVRWEMSQDSEWLVHLSQFGNQVSLVRTPISGGEPEILAENVATTEGKEFDIAHGGERVAFLRRDGENNGRRLHVVGWPVTPSAPAIADSDATPPLVAAGVATILEHYEELVVYANLESREPYCDGQLLAVSTSDGSQSELGPFAEASCDGFSGAILDESRGALLALGSDYSLRLLPGAGRSPVLLPCRALDAKFMQDGRVLFSSVGSGANARLAVYDPKTGASSLVLRELTGPFRLDPASPNSYLTTVPSGVESALVRGTVP